MRIDLKQLFELVGEAVDFNHNLDLSEIQLGPATPFTEPVHLSGRIVNRAGIVSLTYTAAADFSALCDRCLAPINTPVVYQFEHILVKQVYDDDNDTFIVVPDALLDLDELATSDVILELPGKVLCKEDCKGLCSTCGVNLNEQSCNCTKRTIDPRLQKLSLLLEEDDSNPDGV